MASLATPTHIKYLNGLIDDFVETCEKNWSHYVQLLRGRPVPNTQHTQPQTYICMLNTQTCEQTHKYMQIHTNKLYPIIAKIKFAITRVYSEIVYKKFKWAPRGLNT